MPKAPDPVGAVAVEGAAHLRKIQSLLLNAFNTNNRINQYLIDNLPPAVWKAKSAEGKGRTIGAIVAHMHNVRVMWLKAVKAQEVPAQLDRTSVTPGQAVRALESSRHALSVVISRAPTGDGRVKGFRPDVASFLGYLIAHDAHHRGQITMLARQVGHPLPQKVFVFGMGVGFTLTTLSCSSPPQVHPIGKTQAQSSCDQAMRKAALLYNPDSGGNVARRRRELQQSSLEVLRTVGVEADPMLSESFDHADRSSVRQAIASGCDNRDLACGGDGTIHNVAQVLANSAVALAILPMGTANALAHDLGLPLSIVGAAEAALRAVPLRVALGHVTYVDLQGSSDARHFLIVAGVAWTPISSQETAYCHQKRMGMAAYYAKAWDLWFTYPMTRFVAEYLETGSDAPKHADVTELMSIRIRNFGGVLQELAPGASMGRDDMRVVLCRTSSRLSYLAYVTRGLLRQRWRIPGIDLAYSTKVSCGYLSSSAPQEQRKIYIEADGELLGTLPAEIMVVPNALTLLAPAP